MNFVFFVCKQEINPPTAKDFQLLSGPKPTESLQHALADEVIMLSQLKHFYSKKVLVILITVTSSTRLYYTCIVMIFKYF